MTNAVKMIFLAHAVNFFPHIKFCIKISYITSYARHFYAKYCTCTVLNTTVLQYVWATYWKISVMHGCCCSNMEEGGKKEGKGISYFGSGMWKQFTFALSFPKKKGKDFTHRGLILKHKYFMPKIVKDRHFLGQKLIS